MLLEPVLVKRHPSSLESRSPWPTPTTTHHEGKRSSACHAAHVPLHKVHGHLQRGLHVLNIHEPLQEGGWRMGGC